MVRSSADHSAYASNPLPCCCPHLLLLLVPGRCGGRLLHVCGDEVALVVVQRRCRLVQRRLAPLLGRWLGGCVEGTATRLAVWCQQQHRWHVQRLLVHPGSRGGRRGSFSCGAMRLVGLTSSAPLGGPMVRAPWMSFTPSMLQGTARGSSGPECRAGLAAGERGGRPAAEDPARRGCAVSTSTKPSDMTPGCRRECGAWGQARGAPTNGSPRSTLAG